MGAGLIPDYAIKHHMQCQQHLQQQQQQQKQRQQQRRQRQEDGGKGGAGEKEKLGAGQLLEKRETGGGGQQGGHTHRDNQHKQEAAVELLPAASDPLPQPGAPLLPLLQEAAQPRLQVPDLGLRGKRILVDVAGEWRCGLVTTECHKAASRGRSSVVAGGRWWNVLFGKRRLVVLLPESARGVSWVFEAASQASTAVGLASPPPTVHGQSTHSPA